ncbi:putative D-ribose-binding periplasmic protein precursor [Pelagibacterium halotolerans B2]|uniref:Putative D-ribose-binding periplasmic protein n=1 Tax=Pelagibacterium halotolerans (strain DSM 22347 / JCM 15775 / CGMCC 1.7692 / B2) TaxID=1082931 RepID=G4RAT0_PELHB|nr:substrate-binding domain-containing protein [Pelagibacterium halotolerans]AEQ52607.1 putative D-ribose-binding periplasmic protein precursor [Pelagibacterium halotolerans B2]
MPISGLGPHGERATPPSSVELSETDIAASRERGFSVTVVMHTMNGDYSKQQLAGIVGTLGDYGAIVPEVVDCHFDPRRQVEALDRLIASGVDAIVSIPIGNADVVEAHRRVAKAGIQLILLDNVPTGLLPGSDYVSLVSADNFGLGQVAAELLSPYVPSEGHLGVLAYGVDFYATNEREIAFAKWIQANRPDVRIATRKFSAIEDARAETEALLQSDADIAALFVVWEAPAIGAMTALKAQERSVPLTTIDLGRDVAVALADNAIIKGIGAQQPFAQGAVGAKTTVRALLGHRVPAWVALPALAVTQSNVIESWQMVWRAPAPNALISLRRT